MITEIKDVESDLISLKEETNKKKEKARVARHQNDERERRCFNCGSSRHLIRECNKKCSKCHRRGHRDGQCPTRRRSYREPSSRREEHRHRSKSQARGKSRTRGYSPGPRRGEKSKKSSYKHKSRRTSGSSASSRSRSRSSGGYTEESRSPLSSDVEEVQRSGDTEKKRTHKARSVRLFKGAIESARRVGLNSGDTPSYFGTLGASRGRCSELRATEELVPDTGATMTVVPLVVAKRNRLPIDRDEGQLTQLISSSGHELCIIGTTSMWAKIEGFNNMKYIRGIVVDGPNIQPEVLLGWKYLKDWGVLPSTFPYPEDSKERNKVRVVRREKDKIDEQLEEMRIELLEKYKDVFKTKLGKKDRVAAPPMVIKIDKERMERDKPRQATVPIPIPAHMRRAADKELEDMLSAGFLEPCLHETTFASRGFFREKKAGENKDLRARLV